MWREIVAVPATNVFIMPEEMSYEEGAAIPLSYLTAYFMLFDFGNLRPGKSLLVHIAAGELVLLLHLFSHGGKRRFFALLSVHS